MPNPETATDWLPADIAEDGCLTSTVPYVFWRPGDEMILLDGLFSVEELRALVEHLEAAGISGRTIL